jgi:hypothetical protein
MRYGLLFIQSEITILELYQSENQEQMKKKSITASEFDQKFDSNENIMDHLDLNKASRPGLEQRRVSVDFPDWMVKELDRVSKRLGVTRQSIIKIFISDKLKEEMNG